MASGHNFSTAIKKCKATNTLHLFLKCVAMLYILHVLISLKSLKLIAISNKHDWQLAQIKGGEKNCSTLMSAWLEGK